MLEETLKAMNGIPRALEEEDMKTSMTSLMVQEAVIKTMTS